MCREHAAPRPEGEPRGQSNSEKASMQRCKLAAPCTSKNSPMHEAVFQSSALHADAWRTHAHSTAMRSLGPVAPALWQPRKANMKQQEP
jgi:hypothetical protein